MLVPTPISNLFDIAYHSFTLWSKVIVPSHVGSMDLCQLIGPTGDEWRRNVRNMHAHTVYTCKRLCTFASSEHMLCFQGRKLTVYPPFRKQSFSERSTAFKEILSPQITSVLFWYVLVLIWFEIVLPLWGVPHLDITQSLKFNWKYDLENCC